MLVFRRGEDVSPLPCVLTEGEHCWGEWQISVSRLPVAAAEKGDALYLRSEAVDRIEVDAWRGGEGLELPSSRGKRSVKRLLTERGIPPEERRSIPCIRVNGTAAAVYSLGTDMYYLPGETGEKIEILLQKREKIQEEQQ